MASSEKPGCPLRLSVTCAQNDRMAPVKGISGYVSWAQAG